MSTDGAATAIGTKYGRGRPKKGEIRAPKLPKTPGVIGHPTAARALERAKARANLAEQHAREVISAARAKTEALQKKDAQAQRRRLREVGGAVPTDPLAAADRLCRILVESAELALTDSSLKPAEMRAELRQIARSVHALIPASRMLEVERMMRRATEKMNEPGSDPKTKPPLPSSGPLRMSPRRDG